MSRPIFFRTLLAAALTLFAAAPALAAGNWGQATVDPLSYTGVDHVVVWCIYEVVGDKIATVRLVGQLTDPETKRFVQYGKPAK